jgi:putative ABC transport system permease protein
VPDLRLKRPGYLALTTGVVALAVGVNLIVFTIVNALWLRPLPVADADRLVTLPMSPYLRVDTDWLRGGFGEDVAGQVLSDRLGAFRLAFDGVGRTLETIGVTSRYFRVLGVRIHGRDFTPDDDRRGAEPVAILSHRTWVNDFGRRADIIGTVVPATPVSVRVIGIAAPGFEGARRGDRGDVWIPANVAPRLLSTEIDWSLSLLAIARLPSGRSLTDVEQHLRQTHPSEREGARLELLPLSAVFGTPESRTIVIREESTFKVVAGLALIVLAGGCVTLAALMLVHYERRRPEFAIKAALGASRGRIVRDLSSEVLLIAVTGTAAALLVAYAGLRLIPALSLPGGVDLGRLDLSFDWRVVTAAGSATLLTLAGAASLPAFHATRRRLAGDALASSALTPSSASQRLRQTLLAAQVAAAIVVLVSAGLFVRAVAHGFGKAPGFDIDRTLFVTAQILSPLKNYGADMLPLTAARTVRVREAIGSIPGVDDVAYGTPPIDPGLIRLRRPIAIETEGVTHEGFVGALAGSPQLLSTLGVPILAGRGLQPGDESGRPVPAVVTASLAYRLSPSTSPLGKVLTTSWRGGQLTIVGIAPDFVFGSLARPASGVVIRVVDDTFYGLEARYVVRADRPEQMVEPIRQAAQAAVPDAPWIKVATGRDIIARDMGRQRLGAWFFSWFGLTALMLAIGGVFGLVAYLAESRQREFGVRLALGATPADLLRLGMKAALTPVAAGVAIGCVLGGVVSGLFVSLLSGVSPVDPVTYAGVALTMLTCASAAALTAAWRLRRMMPTDALRSH